MLDRVPDRVDVLRHGAREAADHGALDLLGDRGHGRRVTGRRDRESRLDHVHSQPGELMRDLQLLLDVQRDPGRLLPVAQGRVEYEHALRVLTVLCVGPL